MQPINGYLCFIHEDLCSSQHIIIFVGFLKIFVPFIIYLCASFGSLDFPPPDEVPSKCQRSAFKLSTMCLQSPPFGGTSRRVWRHLSQGLPVPCGAIGGYPPAARRLFLECKGTTDYAKGYPLLEPKSPKYMLLV